MLAQRYVLSPWGTMTEGCMADSAVGIDKSVELEWRVQVD